MTDPTLGSPNPGHARPFSMTCQSVAAGHAARMRKRDRLHCGPKLIEGGISEHRRRVLGDQEERDGDDQRGEKLCQSCTREARPEP